MGREEQWYSIVVQPTTVGPRSEENTHKANGGARAAHDAGLSRLKHWLLRISGISAAGRMEGVRCGDWSTEAMNLKLGCSGPADPFSPPQQLKIGNASTPFSRRTRSWLIKCESCRSFGTALNHFEIKKWCETPPNSTKLQVCQVRDILQLTSHAMLRAVRVVLANGSLAEARDLQKMLTKAISVVEEEQLAGSTPLLVCWLQGLELSVPLALIVDTLFPKASPMLGFSFSLLDGGVERDRTGPWCGRDVWWWSGMDAIRDGCDTGWVWYGMGVMGVWYGIGVLNGMGVIRDGCCHTGWVWYAMGVMGVDGGEDWRWRERDCVWTGVEGCGRGCGCGWKMDGSETGCGRAWTGLRMEDGGRETGCGRVWTGVWCGQGSNWVWTGVWMGVEWNGGGRDWMWTGVDGGLGGRWRAPTTIPLSPRIISICNPSNLNFLNISAHNNEACLRLTLKHASYTTSVHPHLPPFPPGSSPSATPSTSISWIFQPRTKHVFETNPETCFVHDLCAPTSTPLSPTIISICSPFNLNFLNISAHNEACLRPTLKHASYTASVRPQLPPFPLLSSPSAAPSTSISWLFQPTTKHVWD